MPLHSEAKGTFVFMVPTRMPARRLRRTTVVYLGLSLRDTLRHVSTTTEGSSHGRCSSDVNPLTDDDGVHDRRVRRRAWVGGGGSGVTEDETKRLKWLVGLAVQRRTPAPTKRTRTSLPRSECDATTCRVSCSRPTSPPSPKP